MNTRNAVPSILLNDPFADFTIINCKGNQMNINNHIFEVTEKHKRLVIFLLKGITQKNDIINIVWYEQGGMVSDNNYHQLIHKFRNLLSDNNLPKSMLRTIPRHGAILDLTILPVIADVEQPTKTTNMKKQFKLKTACVGLMANLSLFAKTLYR